MDKFHEKMIIKITSRNYLRQKTYKLFLNEIYYLIAQFVQKILPCTGTYYEKVLEMKKETGRIRSRLHATLFSYTPGFFF